MHLHHNLAEFNTYAIPLFHGCLMLICSLFNCLGLITDELVLKNIDEVGDLGDTTKLRWECLKAIFLRRMDEQGSTATIAPLNLLPHNVSV